MHVFTRILCPSLLCFFFPSISVFLFGPFPLSYSFCSFPCHSSPVILFLLPLSSVLLSSFSFSLLFLLSSFVILSCSAPQLLFYVFLFLSLLCSSLLLFFFPSPLFSSSTILFCPSSLFFPFCFSLPLLALPCFVLFPYVYSSLVVKQS